MKTSKLFFICLFFSSLAYAQHGYLRFDTHEIWNVSLSDTSAFASDTCLALPPGRYYIAARPQWDNSWPGIILQDSLTVAAGDTIIFALRRTKKYLKPPDIGNTMPLHMTRPLLMTGTGARFSKNTKRIVLVGAIAANWIGFFLKRRADNYYSKYQSSNTLSEIDKNFHRSRQFDNLSSALLGISLAAFGTYIYMIVSE